ncbi:hypothetical protein MKEN_00007400 [Mycena kentingensis (nom. inval.)]|nr:hypothetical protein MKEN_00007400 [Mycena kentingensis (nom. inval.)]
MTGRFATRSEIFSKQNIDIAPLNDYRGHVTDEKGGFMAGVSQFGLDDSSLDLNSTESLPAPPHLHLPSRRPHHELPPPRKPPAYRPERGPNLSYTNGNQATYKAGSTLLPTTAPANVLLSLSRPGYLVRLLTKCSGALIATKKFAAKAYADRSILVMEHAGLKAQLEQSRLLAAERGRQLTLLEDKLKLTEGLLKQKDDLLKQKVKKSGILQ